MRQGGRKTEGVSWRLGNYKKSTLGGGKLVTHLYKLIREESNTGRNRGRCWGRRDITPPGWGGGGGNDIIPAQSSGRHAGGRLRCKVRDQLTEKQPNGGKGEMGGGGAPFCWRVGTLGKLEAAHEVEHSSGREARRGTIKRGIRKSGTQRHTGGQR